MTSHILLSFGKTSRWNELPPLPQMVIILHTSLYNDNIHELRIESFRKYILVCAV